MNRWILPLLVALVPVVSVQAKGRFDGSYVGDASARLFGQKISAPVSFKIKGQQLTGKILVPGASKVVSITGSVNGGSGHLVGFVTAQFGITGQFTGRVTKAGHLTAAGRLFIPGFGSVAIKIVADKLETKSPFRGTWLATNPPTQAIVRVEVGVTPQGIATLTFQTSSGQRFTDNREVSDDGQCNSVINGFIYFVKLDAGGTFTGSYQGVLGTGSFAGTRTSMGGVESSLAGAYAAINSDPSQPAVKLRFVVSNDRSLVGSFEFRDGSTVPFTNVVGDLNDFAGTTQGGINYFAKIAADGTFTLSYQGSRGSGSFAGKKK